LRQIGESIGTTRFDVTLEQQFEAIRGKSVDYAIMEHYPNVAVLEASFAWDDLGSWQSIARLRGVDSEGNTILGKHVGVNTQGTIVKTDDRHLVVTLGLRDCLIVRTPDATLVANKHDEESIRKVVEILQAKGWTEYL
jgi:mannose-1-phosphate guanylyltransferase